MIRQSVEQNPSPTARARPFIHILRPPYRFVRHTTHAVFRHTPLNFDRAYDVDTENTEADIGIAKVQPREGPQRYAATSPKHFRFAMRHVPSPLDDWNFVDIGSGKGRIVFLAMGYPFRHVRGVEYDRDLHEKAEENLRRFRGPRRAASVSLDCADALSAPLPAGDTIIFFYNSLRGPMLDEFLDRLEASVRADPRRILFFYSNPKENERLARRTSFRTIFQGRSGYDPVAWSNRRLAVYEIQPPGTSASPPSK